MSFPNLSERQSLSAQHCGKAAEEAKGLAQNPRLFSVAYPHLLLLDLKIVDKTL